jgi:hypothetical protein
MTQGVRSARWILVACCLVPLAASAVSTAPREVPTRLSDEAFWDIVTSFSEDGGFFASHNWVSNETLYQHVVPKLTGSIKPGGVYVGVGPDQNFTYVGALKPSLAFIVDIRRQNLLHHLLYKALMELSPTRAEFVSKLFGRPKPRDLKDDASAESLLTAFSAQAESGELIAQTTDDIIGRLTRQRGFTLSESDRSTLMMVHQAFYGTGPGITYSGVPSFVSMVGDQRVQWRASPFPSYADLVAMTDGAGVNRGYLASEAHYKVIREMQLRNAIIPVVGDFAGPKALRAVGKYVKDRGGVVTTFYTSNVEQYLFQNNVWRTYYENIAAMPLDETSTFIRSYFGSGASFGILLRGPQGQLSGAPATPPPTGPTFIASSQLLCSVRELLAAIAAGRVSTYPEVIGISR